MEKDICGQRYIIDISGRYIIDISGGETLRHHHLSCVAKDIYICVRSPDPKVGGEFCGR